MRSHRPLSPSRRGPPPGRASLTALDSGSQAHYSTSARDAYSSPRTSVERVIPISEKTYVNGKLVKSTLPDSGYESHPHRRRGTYDGQDPPRYPASPSAAAPAPIVHNSADRPSEASRSAKYDDYYVTAGASAPRHHKKTYSVDTAGSSRLLDPGRDKEAKRLVELDKSSSRQRQGSADQRDARGYHLSGRAPRRVGAEDYAGYEYTNARGMYETTEPLRRSRHGSASSRERPTSMFDGFGPPPRASTTRDGPPVSMRGFDKINGGVTRHSSIADARERSPQRYRERGSGSLSEDDGFPVAPRMANRVRDGSRDYYSPATDRFDDRRQPRTQRFEDKDLSTRGFGIRSTSVDPHARAPSLDMPVPRSIEAPPEPNHRRETMPPEPSPRDTAFALRKAPEPSARRDMDRREADRPADREPSRPLERDQQPRDRDRERDVPKMRDFEDDRRRDRDYAPDRGSFSRFDDLPLRRERRDKDPPERRSTIDDAPPRRERPRDDDHPSSGGLSSMLPAAVAGAAGLYAASKGKKHYDERERAREDAREERPREERARPREDRAKEDRPREESKREDRAAPPPTRSAEEGDSREPEPLRIERPHQRDGVKDIIGGQRDQAYALPLPVPVEKPEKPALRRESTEDSPPRVRHYVDKDASNSGTRSTPPNEQSDADTDYKRRIQAELERSSRRTGDSRDSDSERERQRQRHGDARGATGPASKDIEAGKEEDRSFADDAQALTPYQPPEDDERQVLDRAMVDEPDTILANERAKKRVAIVEPPKEKEVPRSILRPPTEKFPEHPNGQREGVAPLKPVPGAPDGVRWTKIDRAKVNPETLEEAKERFEERRDHVIVLRVVDEAQIQKWAERTEQIRTARYEYRHRHDSEREREVRHERNRERERPRDVAQPERRHRREHRRGHHDDSEDSQP